MLESRSRDEEGMPPAPPTPGVLVPVVDEDEDDELLLPPPKPQAFRENQPPPLLEEEDALGGGAPWRDALLSGVLDRDGPEKAPAEKEPAEEGGHAEGNVDEEDAVDGVGGSARSEPWRLEREVFLVRAGMAAWTRS